MLTKILSKINFPFLIVVHESKYYYNAHEIEITYSKDNCYKNFTKDFELYLKRIRPNSFYTKKIIVSNYKWVINLFDIFNSGKKIIKIFRAKQTDSYYYDDETYFKYRINNKKSFGFCETGLKEVFHKIPKKLYFTYIEILY